MRDFLPALVVTLTLYAAFYFAFDLSLWQAVAVGGTLAWFVVATAPR
jgi:hypothetical protein